MARLAIILVVFVASLVGVALPAAAVPKSIVDIIRTNPKLSTARQWAEESGILQKVDLSHYGDKVTIVLPSNSAFRDLEAEHPTWKAQLVSSSEDVETVSPEQRTP